MGAFGVCIVGAALGSCSIGLWVGDGGSGREGGEESGGDGSVVHLGGVGIGICVGKRRVWWLAREVLGLMTDELMKC